MTMFTLYSLLFNKKVSCLLLNTTLLKFSTLKKLA